MSQPATALTSPPGESVRSRARGLFNLLRRLEHERITGLVQVCGRDGESLGQVMAASGRVCFVAPAGGQAPIGEWLAEEDAAFRARLDEAVNRARRSRRRLCESLLDDGELPLERLREALRNQVARGLLSLVPPGANPEPRLAFTPARDDYDRRLTFSALDAFARAASLLDTAPVDQARRLFDEYVAYADAALLLARGHEAGALPLPLAAHGLEELSVADVISLARSAEGTLRPPSLAEAGASPRLVVFSGREGVWVCGRGKERLVLLRTGPEFGAGQIIGFALRLWAPQAGASGSGPGRRRAEPGRTPV